MPRSNGSTGSTTAACWSRSATCPRPKPTRPTTGTWSSPPQSPPESTETASEKAGTVHLLKTDARQYLISAIETLAAHKPFFTAKVSEALLDSFLSRGALEGSPLTHRERSVVQLIAEGYTNKQVSGLLKI